MRSQALAMAESLGLDELRAHALDNLGCARCNAGDLTGLRDLERLDRDRVGAQLARGDPRPHEPAPRSTRSSGTCGAPRR